MLDICLGCHIGLAAGGQSAHALPVLASARSITPQPPQVAALEQRRDRIRRQCESLFDIDERRIEAVESAISEAR